MRRVPHVSTSHKQLTRWLPGPWLAALALSLIGHGLLLSGEAAPPSEQALRPGQMVARHVPQPLSAPPTVPPAAPAPATAPQAMAAKPDRAPAPVEPVAPAAQAEQAELVGPSPTGDAAPAPRPPAAGEWHYVLLQNGFYGRARLRWQTEAESYSLQLERELDGRPLPSWKSQGMLGPAGLMPQRYVQQRRGRDMAATNFRHEEGLISFSASAEEVALPDGVQDRLSWWLQLAALVEAAPQRYRPGSQLRLPVVGLRGEAREWLFEVLSQQTLQLPGASIAQALQLRRAAIGPYSGEIEIWLDPARGHLPVQLSMELPDERGWQMQWQPSDDKP